MSTRNCVDLSLLARTVDNAKWKGKYSSPIGLARLCKTYEELDLPKGKITRSNWELLLSDIQQDCAWLFVVFHSLLPNVMLRCCERLSLWTHAVSPTACDDVGRGTSPPSPIISPSIFSMGIRVTRPLKMSPPCYGILITLITTQDLHLNPRYPKRRRRKRRVR